MKKFWMATVAAILALGLLAGCPDDDTCTECWCDPVYCTDGGDADADADGDVAVEYGNLTVRATAAGVEVNADIELDGSPTGYQTPHTFENLPLDTHDILLSYPGRIQGPSPMEVDVPPEGTEVNIFLYHDLTGSRWHRNDGMDRDFSMQISPPDYRCPDTWVRVINVSPVGTLCLEIDDTLSLQNPC